MRLELDPMDSTWGQDLDGNWRFKEKNGRWSQAPENNERYDEGDWYDGEPLDVKSLVNVFNAKWGDIRGS